MRRYCILTHVYYKHLLNPPTSIPDNPTIPFHQGKSQLTSKFKYFKYKYNILVD